jgi:hypothetical protein
MYLTYYLVLRRGIWTISGEQCAVGIQPYTHIKVDVHLWIESAYSEPKMILLNKYFGVVLTSEAIFYKLKLGGGGFLSCLVALYMHENTCQRSSCGKDDH